VKEITQQKGEATVFEARFVEGLRDGEVRLLFKDARDQDYRELIQDARRVISALSLRARAKDLRAKAESDLRRLQRRLEEIASLDFFGGHHRQSAELALRNLEAILRSGNDAGIDDRSSPNPLRDFQGRTWVTRQDIHVDRMASAWLIRRFIDSRARFRFVQKNHVPRRGEIRFDMFEGEFTHEGDLCTFEVLVRRMGLRDEGLIPLQEMVHDIDLKDDKFKRPETRGLESIIRAIAMAHKPDLDRLARASALLDDLYESFRKARR